MLCKLFLNKKKTTKTYLFGLHSLGSEHYTSNKNGKASLVSFLSL